MRLEDRVSFAVQVFGDHYIGDLPDLNLTFTPPGKPTFADNHTTTFYIDTCRHAGRPPPHPDTSRYTGEPHKERYNTHPERHLGVIGEQAEWSKDKDAADEQE